MNTVADCFGSMSGLPQVPRRQKVERAQLAAQALIELNNFGSFQLSSLGGKSFPSITT